MRTLPSGILGLIVLLGLAACKSTPEDTGSGGGNGDDGGTGDDGTGDDGADDTGDGPTWDARFDPFVAALQEDLEASLSTGVSVAIWQDGEIVFAEGFGTARPGEDLPVTPTTLFQIGSTTKMQTATGLLQQVDAGRLDLDAPLSEVLPDLDFDEQPGVAGTATMRDLLSHRGGFYDWLDWQQASDDELLQSYTYDFFDTYLWCMSPPGALWNYSNPNFVLQGVVTEDLDPEGRYWPDYMVDEVYRPLGMDRTFLRKSEVYDDGDYALGVGLVDLTTGEIGNAGWRDITDPAWARPAGLAWSTPTQMLSFARFLMVGNEEVLSTELSEALRAPQSPLEAMYPDEDHAYGYGVFVSPGIQVSETEYIEVPHWDHGGNTLWFTSAFHVLPEQDFAISILSNGYGDDYSRSVATAITTLIGDLPEPVAPPEYVMDPEGLDAHVGTYDDPFNVGELIITREGDALLVEMPFLTELGYDVTPELYGVSTDLWYLQLDGAYFELRFIADEAADPDRSAWAASRVFVTARVDESAAAFAPKAPRNTDPERLRRLLTESRTSPLELPPALR